MVDSLPGDWFSEISALWPDQALSLKIDGVLCDERSPFQHIQVLRNRTYGNVLVLDGIIQATERDEFAYQEMIANLPLYSHPHPRHVLVVGGGDGGVVREVVKHPLVESVVLCEIDERVIRVSEQFLPSMAAALKHPKVHVHIEDGVQFLRNHCDAFDVIITDSSDPTGPATALFQRDYYELVRRALRPTGILCGQAENMWLHLNLITDIVCACRELFPVVRYAYTCLPTYPCGQIGFVLASRSSGTDFVRPVRKLTDADCRAAGLRYYNSDVHSAAFVLPQFAQDALLLRDPQAAGML